MKNKNISFISRKNVDASYYPLPAINNIPEWYKKTSPYIGSNHPIVFDGKTNASIKKCIPFFDAMTTGYILFTYIDIYVHFDQHGSHYSCPNNANASGVIEFHSNEQAKKYPQSNKMDYPKFLSPWSILTPNGYSCLFVPPINNPNNFFTIFSGVVDTDSYHNEINFPFILNSPTFDGIIPAGTPICQVIPFKRDSFKMSIDNDEKSVKLVNKFFDTYNIKFFNNYKTRFWKKKHYK